MFRSTMSAVLLSAVSLSAQFQSSGLVFTTTNDINNNQLVIGASVGGQMLELGRAFTGGKGTGTGLGSQGALAASSKYLLVVNAGSNNVALFIRQGGPTVIISDVRATGGKRPTSVDVKGDLVYVLNADSDDLTGFRIHKGLLQLIGRFPLSGTGVGGAQVGFDPRGRFVVVTERATNRILVYPVRHDGSLDKPAINPSAGKTPFGFMFRRDILVVSEAFGGQPGRSTASSYMIVPFAGGKLANLTIALGTKQTAACWVGVTRNGHFAYTTNTASSTITGVSIDQNGLLALLDSNGITAKLDAGARPLDLDFNASGHLLFVLDSGRDEVVSFYRDSKGALHRAPGSLKLPDGAAGLIAN